jgi:hypothetical protein
MEQNPTKKKLLGMVKPPKPISQMTPEELDRFVKETSERMGERLSESQAEPD